MEINIYINGSYDTSYESNICPRVGEVVVFETLNYDFKREARKYKVISVEHIFQQFFEFKNYIDVKLEEESE
jgi:hypothetical protein